MDGFRVSYKGLWEWDGGGYRFWECVFCVMECCLLVKLMELCFRSLVNNNVVWEWDFGWVMDLVKF